MPHLPGRLAPPVLAPEEVVVPRWRSRLRASAREFHPAPHPPTCPPPSLAEYPHDPRWVNAAGEVVELAPPCPRQGYLLPPPDPQPQEPGVVPFWSRALERAHMRLAGLGPLEAMTVEEFAAIVWASRVARVPFLEARVALRAAPREWRRHGWLLLTVTRVEIDLLRSLFRSVSESQMDSLSLLVETPRPSHNPSHGLLGMICPGDSIFSAPLLWGATSPR